MRLSPARRVIYGLALAASRDRPGAAVQRLRRRHRCGCRFRFNFVRVGVPGPLFAHGTAWLLIGFLLMNLLVLLEVADRLSLKRDLEVAREIQQAMLPDGMWSGPGVEAFGLTKPANTVGGDFYDILPQPDGTGHRRARRRRRQGQPGRAADGAAAGDDAHAGGRRARHRRAGRAAERPDRASTRRASRFITLFVASYDPRTGEMEFVNAGQTPPLLRRQNGSIERLTTGGIALGMFEGSTYEAGTAQLEPGDALVMYSDGITEAEDPTGQPFDEAGLERTLALYPGTFPEATAASIGQAIFDAVERHRRDSRLADDLSVLVLSRLRNSVA